MLSPPPPPTGIRKGPHTHPDRAWEQNEGLDEKLFLCTEAIFPTPFLRLHPDNRPLAVQPPYGFTVEELHMVDLPPRKDK